MLDNYTVGRVIKVYGEQAEDVDLYEEQLARWKKLELTHAQRREVDRLADEIPRIRTLITGILTLADELKGGTIEAVLAKSDFEVGLEFFLGTPDELTYARTQAICRLSRLSGTDR